VALLEGDTLIEDAFWEVKGLNLLGVNACVIATVALQRTSDMASLFFLGLLFLQL